MAGQTDMELIKNGVRLDGRKPDELREVKIVAGVLDNADGSCYLEWGNNKIYAGVFGPMECHPRHKQKADRAIVQARYTMAPFSVNDRKRPGKVEAPQEFQCLRRIKKNTPIPLHIPQKM